MKNQLFNVQNMQKTIRENKGFDYIIVVSSNEGRAEFWQERLEGLKGEIVGENAKIISQTEDWLDGAGQLLGTLYGFKKASKKNNLIKELKRGKKVAIYHASGFGKRMAPLSLTEEGGKPAIKLPRLIKIKGQKDFLRLLEGVIFSTQIFASSREKRLCVFWGDQIVIPATSPRMEEECPAEIFGIKKPIPKKAEIWGKEWKSYGLLAVNKKGEFLQREKLPWKDFKQLNRESELKELQKSLGFFSLSLRFLETLLEEFKLELAEKLGRLDTDSHLWMPLTCSKKEYLNRGGSSKHWQRINQFKEKFLEKANPQVSLIRIEDVGENSFWWDFGQLSSYQRNLLKALNSNLEGECLRKIFGLEKFWQRQEISNGSEIRNSILVNSKVKGKIQKSLVLNTKVKNLDIKNSLLFNADSPEFFGKEALAYNLQEPRKIILKKQEILTDIFSEVGKIRIRTKTGRDGKKDWEKKILGNPISYQRLTQFI